MHLDKMNTNKNCHNETDRKLYICQTLSYMFETGRSKHLNYDILVNKKKVRQCSALNVNDRLNMYIVRNKNMTYKHRMDHICYTK